jgi:hypothetical protein
VRRSRVPTLIVAIGEKAAFALHVMLWWGREAEPKLTETKEMWCLSKVSIILAKSRSERS